MIDDAAVAAAAAGRPVTLHASDGQPLAARVFGDAATARAGVVLAPAMGVPQGYYADFAEALAGAGLMALSFDYRGMGQSRPVAHRRSLRGFDTDIVRWAERDAAAALAHLQAELGPGRPVHWVGHSLGGQILGLVPGAERVARMVTVGAGSGYWRINAPRLKRIVWFMWYGAVPLTVPLLGYFPGDRLGMVGDLPRGVILQWRRWCLDPNYMMGEGGDALRARYAGLRLPILSLGFADDEFMSERSIAALHDCYAGAPQERMRIAPAELGEPRIGHFGFFKKRFAASLWPRAIQWLHQETPA